MILEPAHLIASPTGYSPVVDALALVGYHKILADADDLSKTSAHRASPKRAIEREQILVRLTKSHSVKLKTVGELFPGIILHKDKFPLSLPESVVDG